MRTQDDEALEAEAGGVQIGNEAKKGKGGKRNHYTHYFTYGRRTKKKKKNSETGSLVPPTTLISLGPDTHVPDYGDLAGTFGRSQNRGWTSWAFDNIIKGGLFVAVGAFLMQKTRGLFPSFNASASQTGGSSLLNQPISVLRTALSEASDVATKYANAAKDLIRGATAGLFNSHAGQTNYSGPVPGVRFNPI